MQHSFSCRNLNTAWCLKYHGEVGGDYLGIFQVDPSTVVYIIADICGHGEVAHARKTFFERLLSEEMAGFTTLSSIFARLNDRLCDDPQSDRFISAFGIVYSEKDKIVTYANAGHPPQYIITNHRLFSLDAPGYLLGMFPKANYSEKDIILTNDASIVLYTDGYEEELYKNHQCELEVYLRELVADTFHDRGDDIMKRMHSDLPVFEVGTSITDDAILCIIQIGGIG